MKIPGFDERQTVPVDYSMPLRRSWLQQEHDRMQQSHSVVRERKDARDPVLKAVGLSQPVQLPSGFGDVKLKKLDAMLWDFCKSSLHEHGQLTRGSWTSHRSFEVLT